MAVWLVVFVLAIVCFWIGFTMAAKALFIVGLVLLAVAVGGGARGGRRGLASGRRTWRRRRRTLI